MSSLAFYTASLLLTAYDVGYLLGRFLGFILVGILYFLPTVLARKKSKSTQIFLLNLLAGWTGIGWIGALIWALSSDKAQPMPVRIVGSASVANELANLQALRDNGSLSEEEFHQQRQRLLNQPN
ncbi:superinfection immunity protein [Hymenobacter metallilatus]|uniref:Superinfection immunity protein n=1 Tax=Hymenobacter metallilatus TaxID=2493666 RepID=A0A3R9P7B4_9BACT|nr:superinfection immunity protein [Hymenobacter metallilatus]RSK29885.1 superinfection immunity protein [Hymenobacter metallilatus]